MHGVSLTMEAFWKKEQCRFGEACGIVSDLHCTQGSGGPLLLLLPAEAVGEGRKPACIPCVYR